MELADVERAIAARDPQLGTLICRYLEQDDKDPGRSELEASRDDDDGDHDDDDEIEDVPPGAMTIDRLVAAVSERGLANKTPTERKLARVDAFAAAAASPFAPPRLRLGKLLLELYLSNHIAGRAALLHVFAHGRMRWGVWQAAKHIYKRAEASHDAAMFGVLAFRFDAMAATDYAKSELGQGTLIYLRRRAWRYLRLLGHAVPDAYPAFAVEVLRHYPPSYAKHSPSWVAAHVWNGKIGKGVRSLSFAPGGTRAFPATWKASPAPLLRLLDAAQNDLVCEWAIKLLRGEHALVLRAVEPAWLARLGQRRIPSIDAFVVSLLKESPELHQSRLRELGLHDVVIGFLESDAKEARAYALEYAAAHAPDLPVDKLLALLEDGESDVKKFAEARLVAMTPAQLGIRVLLRLIEEKWAAAKLAQGFAPGDVDAELFVATAERDSDAFKLLIKFFNDARVAVPTRHWTALLDNPEIEGYGHRQTLQLAFGELGKRPAREIGIAWIQKALEDRRRTDAVARWLDAGMLSGDELDVEWLKRLVGKPRLRPIALKLLGDRKRVAPVRVGLAWLLEIARSSDADLAKFAQRMLLESFEPEDFASGDKAAPEGGTDETPGARRRAAGVARLWELAAGKKQPEPVRQFAATYLKAHHPDLGPRLAEARALGIKPRLGRDAYALATLRPLFDDDRADVRRLAVAVAGEELVRWKDVGLVYELAGSGRSEARALGGEFLLGTIVEGDARRVPAAWIDGARLFQLAESSHKAAREVALTLIRRLYERVGGAEKLAWLMDSPERDVRLFAVRLFWERHKPKPWASDFTPRKQVAGASAAAAERFADLAALRQFARVVLFGLPPGRIGERDAIVEGAPRPERALPASVGKRRLIEAIRDVGLEDGELARALRPVLGELAESIAKGEWQASVQALTAWRARHGVESEAA